MSSVAVTALTDFILAAQTMLLAVLLGRMRPASSSAAWFWSRALWLMGLGALIGAIHHGFFPPPSATGYWIERLDWIVLGGMTLRMLLAAARQFFPPRFYSPVRVIAWIQFAVNTALVLSVDDFLVVTLNYAPVMVVLLIADAFGMRSGAGFWDLAAGLLVMLAAAGIQASTIEGFAPFDHNGLYHVVSMAGVYLLYRAGLRMKREV